MDDNKNTDTITEIELSEEEKLRASRISQLREVNASAMMYFRELLSESQQGKLGYEYFCEKLMLTNETIAKFNLGIADIYEDDLYTYLKHKGYSDEIIQETGLVYFDDRHGAHDRFINRAMVPIMDMNGECIAFGGRALGGEKPKYMITRETELFDKSNNLFALYLARRSHRRGVILCEGYMDVITQHQTGFDNAISFLGTAFTMEQALLIKQFTKEVYLSYDSDDAGKNATKKVIQILRSQGISQRVIDLFPYRDPQEFLMAEGAQAYEERIRDAIPGEIFEIREIRKLYWLEDLEEKTAFIREAAKTLAGIVDAMERENYCDMVAEENGLEGKVLRQEMTRFCMDDDE